MVLSSSCRCAQGLKPSDHPEIVREFETRLLLVVFPVLCLFLFFLYYIYIYIFYPGVGALFFFSTYYTPMEVVPPVGMLVYTAVYTLAADGAVFDTPRRTDVCFNVGCSKRCCCRRRRQYDTRHVLTM